MKTFARFLYSLSLLVLLISTGCKPLGEAQIDVSFAANAETKTPIASSRTLIVLENTLTAGTLIATNPAKAVLTFSIVTPPANGTVTIIDAAAGSYTYEPNLNYVGADSFTFKVNDGSVDSNIATISITVSEVNAIPVATAGVLAVDEDNLGSGTLVASDADLEPLTYSIVANAANGVVTITDSATGAYTYQPNGNFSGLDSFTFRANDGAANSNTATISITVNPLNDVPAASVGVLAINEDSLGTGALVANDADGDTLAYSVVATPANGVVIITNAATGSYTYQPNADFSGTDSFTFRVNDGSVNSNTETINITVSGLSDAPVAVDGSLSAKVDVTKTGTLSASDADGDALTYSIVANASNGAVTITDTATGAYSYVPNPGYGGADSFTFKVNDGSVDSNTATISITVSLVADMHFCPDLVADYLWNNPANWYLDSGCTPGNEANRIPINGDSVFIAGSSFTDQPLAVELASFEGNLSLNASSESVNISIASGGTLKVTDGYWYGITDSVAIAEFTCNSNCENRSTLNGDATFNLNSHNAGWLGAMINGNALFNDNSYTSGGIISGDVTFNGDSIMHGGEIQGLTTFYSNSTISTAFNVTLNHVNFNNLNPFTFSTFPFYPGAITYLGNVNFDQEFLSNPLGDYYGSVNFSYGATITIDHADWYQDTSTWTGTHSWIFDLTRSNWGTINTAEFHSGSGNVGTILGDAVFYSSSTNGDSTNQGYVLGQSKFYGNSYNNSILSGSTEFYDSSFNDSDGTVANATFFGTSVNLGLVTGGAIFTDFSDNASIANGSASDGIILGGAFFNSNSTNHGTVTLDANFDDTACNYGTLLQNANFGPNAQIVNGTVNGNSTFVGTSYNGSLLIGTFGGLVDFPNGVTITLDNMIWNTDASTWTFGGFLQWNFLNNASLASGIAINGNAIFSDTSFSQGYIYGLATFNDTSYNSGGTWGSCIGNDGLPDGVNCNP